MKEGVPQNPGDPSTPEGWERESHVEKVRQRIIWIRNRNRQAFADAIAAVTESDAFLRDGHSLPDFFLQGSREARGVLAELGIDYGLLTTTEFVSKEKLIGSSY